MPTETAYAQAFAPIPALQRTVQAVHPLFAHHFPIAVADGDAMRIFAYQARDDRFEEMATCALTEPYSEPVRAAFPLSVLDGQAACVVTPDLFVEADYPAVIFHEWVHCYQFATCELDLKRQLRLGDAMDDPMWELDYPFPYHDDGFTAWYEHWLAVLATGQTTAIIAARQSLAASLAPDAWDYLVWQEWKEGFARWVEQRVRQHLGMVTVLRAVTPPFNRGAFYAGGAAYIAWLEHQRPQITHDLPSLFAQMRTTEILLHRQERDGEADEQ